MHTEGIPLDGASGMSASSQDGGDEYSSEASELDAGDRVSNIVIHGEMIWTFHELQLNRI